MTILRYLAIMQVYHFQFVGGNLLYPGKITNTHTFFIQTAQDNIDLQTTILSRFDLIFIVKDIRMYSQDKVICINVCQLHILPKCISFIYSL